MLTLCDLHDHLALQETKLSNLAGAASEVRRLRSKLVLSLETYAYNAGPIAEAIDLVEVLNVLIAKVRWYLCFWYSNPFPTYHL